MKQSELIPRKHFKTSFGGELLKSHPKRARPFSPSSAMHVVLKSSQAVGELSFSKHRARLDQLVKRQASRHFIKIYKWQNVGNHLHFVLRAKSQDHFRAFLRSLTGLIPRIVTGTQRGSPLKKRFWDYRPFSRLIHWGQDFIQMKYYLKKNEYEAKGYTTIQARYLLRIDGLWRKLCRQME